MAVPVVGALVHLVGLTAWPGDGTAAAGPIEQAIIGGDDSDPGEYPATGALVRGNSFTCTATLVAPDVVVTAAHCLDGGGWGDLTFTLDADLTDSIDGRIPVLASHPHPDFHLQGAEYTRMGRRNDVGVAILEEPILDVPVERLDSRAYFDEVEEVRLTLCGYGRDYWSTPSTAGVKRDGTIRVEVSNGWELQSTDEDPQPCKGDSGGPLFVPTDEGRLLAGVVSRASGDSAMCDTGAIYTRAAPYVDWIADAATDRDEGGCSASGTGGGPCWPALLAGLVFSARRGRRRRSTGDPPR